VIKAVIFDMDGVLIDAKEWHYEALNKSLSLFGYHISRYDHMVTYDGLPTRKKLKMLTLERGLPEELHPFISEIKQKFTVDCVHRLCKPMFCHEYALSKLKQEGYRLAVCSNAIRNSCRLMLEKAGLLRYLEFFLSNEDVVKPKPDPEIYNTAIKRLGMAPEECLILEDNEHGIKSAIASGANVFIVKTIADVTYDHLKRQIDRFTGKERHATQTEFADPVGG
jgi:HAD superfamily hydrolase (TIGR01509 family)